MGFDWEYLTGRQGAELEVGLDCLFDRVATEADYDSWLDSARYSNIGASDDDYMLSYEREEAISVFREEVYEHLNRFISINDIDEELTDCAREVISELEVDYDKDVEEIFYDGDVWDDFEKELKRIARYEAARYNEKFNNRKIKVLGS